MGQRPGELFHFATPTEDALDILIKGPKSALRTHTNENISGIDFASRFPSRFPPRQHKLEAKHIMLVGFRPCRCKRREDGVIPHRMK